MRPRFLLLIGIASCLVGPKLSAQTTVYSTFGPGDSYDVQGAYNAGVSADVFGIEIWMGAGFLYGGPSGDLLSMIRFAGGPSALGTPYTEPIFAAFLTGATIGGASVLESWILPAGSTPPDNIYSLTSVNQPSLTPGQIYWLMLRPGSLTNSYGLWFLNDQGYVGLQRSGDGGQNWEDWSGSPTPAFDIISTPSSVVPEPATVILLATGLLGLAAMRRRWPKLV